MGNKKVTVFGEVGNRGLRDDPEDGIVDGQ